MIKYVVVVGCAAASLAAPPVVRAQAAVAPGDDFFAYANADWLKATDIPAGLQRWGVRNEIDALTRQQLARLFDDARTQPEGSIARKVADFRAAWLDEGTIEARGVKPIQAQLDRIARIGSKAELTSMLGRGLRADVDPLNWGVYDSSHVLGLAVEKGNNGEPNYVAFLLQGGLGLPDREYYVSAEPRMQALRAKYEDYIGRQLANAGLGRAPERAKAVMVLETAIAQSHATREASANDRNADNLWTRADFAREAPGMDWSVFFAAGGLAKQQTFVAWQPSAVKGVAALFASQPLAAWKDYLVFHAIHRNADVLPKAFANEALALQDAIAGKEQPRDRAARAQQATERALGEAVGRLYVERYFPATHKARVQAIARNVIAALDRRIEAAAWMSAESKKVARAKVQALYFGVGYPEKWQDYGDLAVSPVDAAGNLRRIDERNYRRAVARLGQPVDTTEWWMMPHTVGALLLFQQNAYNFPAALLQATKFDPAASDATNYGAIGAIIGHEASHAVDPLGAEYELDGRNRRWWTAEDVSRYQAACEPLVSQFSAYRPFPDVAIDGKRTLSENSADLVGLAVAFDAHRAALGSRAADKAYVKQQDREFFIGFARSWRAKMTDAGMRAWLANDTHAPDAYRIATVRNIDAWYEAFDVKPGQRLYLAPEARVRVW